MSGYFFATDKIIYQRRIYIFSCVSAHSDTYYISYICYISIYVMNIMYIYSVAKMNMTMKASVEHEISKYNFLI